MAPIDTIGNSNALMLPDGTLLVHLWDGRPIVWITWQDLHSF